MNPYSEYCEHCGQEGGGHKEWHYREMTAAQHAGDRVPKMAADDPRRDEEPPF